MNAHILLRDGRKLGIPDAGQTLGILKANADFASLLNENGGFYLLQDDDGSGEGRILLESGYRIFPQGRQSIGVNQLPATGSDYPFVMPSHDIHRLFGDFYLSYEDQRNEYELPFRISWAYGFGTNQVLMESRTLLEDSGFVLMEDGNPLETEGLKRPTHVRDILVLDRNNRTVFDSTLAHWKEQTWGNGRLQIVQWQNEYEVCRASFYLGWSLTEILGSIARTYDNVITPENGELDARTLNRLSRRLRSIRVGNSVFTKSALELLSGFNIATNIEETETFPAIPNPDGTVAPSRATTQVTIAATSGDGEGLGPSCEGVENRLITINHVGPGTNGAFLLDLGGCLRVQRPVGLVQDVPREFDYFSINNDSGATWWPQNALELGNTCRHPCCDCDYYVRVYEGMRRQWNLWKSLAGEGGNVRDLLQDNKDRWEASRACRAAHSLRSVIVPESECKVLVGASYCNTTNCCIQDLTLRFTLEMFEQGVPIAAIVTSCEQVLAEGPGLAAEGETRALTGIWPVYEVRFTNINPSDNVAVGFRLCVANCKPTMEVRNSVTVHYEDPVPLDANHPCESETVLPPPELEAIWAESWLANVEGAITATTKSTVTTEKLPLSNTRAYCLTCNCPQTT